MPRGSCATTTYQLVATAPMATMRSASWKSLRTNGSIAFATAGHAPRTTNPSTSGRSSFGESRRRSSAEDTCRSTGNSRLRTAISTGTDTSAARVKTSASVTASATLPDLCALCINIGAPGEIAMSTMTPRAGGPRGSVAATRIASKGTPRTAATSARHRTGFRNSFRRSPHRSESPMSNERSVTSCDEARPTIA